ncbi:c-type cytochrome [Aurantiacibacter gangjinensis]|uniref:c-type cytochrome n=1 Tax=Aurantiacibacter gangjinensis TaxID=502682 RepID=UPI00069A3328|nr:c-type cytochrome [Aurantiacibacter gangjinensis]APE27749.1 Cytochrome c2 [Aurantiacibacter gangjinensis]
MRFPLALAFAASLTACGSPEAGDGRGGGEAQVADASSPPRAFNNCTACHAAEAGQYGVGPHLAGIVGRTAGGVEGANYSAALASSGIVWDEDTLVRYLVNPNAVVPGGSMPATGLDEAEARGVVDYLNTL